MSDKPQGPRERFQQLAAHRWQSVRQANPTAPWVGRHPVMELLEEMADGYNYVLAWRAGDHRVSRDLLLAMEALGTTVQSLVEQMEERGADLASFTFPSHRAPYLSSASSTPPPSSEDNSPASGSRSSTSSE
jgi:hypothetical protein